MRVFVIALDDVFDMGLSALLDTFDTANGLAAQSGKPGLRFEVHIVGLRRAVRTHHGLRVPVATAPAEARPDVVLVPALGAKTPAALTAALARADVREAGAMLERWAAAGAVVG